MRLIFILGLLPLSALALATDALAQTRPASLANSEAPGSVIIFPKFINMPAVTVNGDGAILPRTEIEIGAVCPVGASCVGHQPIKIRFHWVCPGPQTIGSLFVCPDVGFDVVLSLNGKLAFTAAGSTLNNNSPRVPAAPCKNGYLIGWVIDTADRPIKFDGLIGDAVIRGPALAAGPNAGTSTAVTAYKAITIQADPELANGDLIATDNDPITGTADLLFDGSTGHYQAVAGMLYGDVKFDKSVAGPPAPNTALNQTYLILLTLNVRSNRPNNPTFVPLDFFNESAVAGGTDPNFESLTSTAWEFLCWTQVQLSAIDTTFGGLPLGLSNLTQDFQGTRKGIVIAGPAEKVPLIGINDPPFGRETSARGDPSVTLIGLVQTIEGSAANGFQERSYITKMFDDSYPIATRFVPFPFD